MKKGYVSLRRPDTAVLPPPDKKATEPGDNHRLLFLAACLYTIVSALSGPGKSDDGTMSIEHIRRLDLRPENNTNPSKQLLR